MNRLTAKVQTYARRKLRSAARIHGTAERPRLSVKITNLHVTAQIINDDSGKTIAYATTVGSKIKGNMTEKAVQVGSDVAKLGKKAKVNQVVFDRGAKIYHGRVKALADAARKEGLDF